MSSWSRGGSSSPQGQYERISLNLPEETTADRTAREKARRSPYPSLVIPLRPRNILIASAIVIVFVFLLVTSSFQLATKYTDGPCPSSAGSQPTASVSSPYISPNSPLASIPTAYPTAPGHHGVTVLSASEAGLMSARTQTVATRLSPITTAALTAPAPAPAIPTAPATSTPAVNPSGIPVSTPGQTTPFTISGPVLTTTPMVTGIGTRLPTEVGAGGIPRLKVPADLEKMSAVRASMKHGWDQYAQRCFGRDELFPLGPSCFDWVGAGLTIVDSLDTLYIMGLDAEYKRGRDWVANSLQFSHRSPSSFFETVIRILAGLLSMYDLTGDAVYRDKSIALGHKLLPAFSTASGMPLGQITLGTARASPSGWSAGTTPLAEAGTLQLEFFALTRHSGNQEFKNKAQRIIDVLDKANKPKKGLYPISVQTSSGNLMHGGKITLGAMGDSFYEYLLKMWLYTGKSVEQYRRMYLESMEGVVEHLYKEAGPYGYVIELDGGSRPFHRMDHLACFTPGMIALGVHTNAVTDPELRKRHMYIADKIMYTCYESYRQQPTGLGPENFHISASGLRPGDAIYRLRPETVESLFVLYRVTGDKKYRDWGWELYKNIERECRHPNGYAGVRDVRNRGSGRDNKMESFLLAETWKYLYLLFTDESVIPLDEFVFNTEAHPFRYATPTP